MNFKLVSSFFQCPFKLLDLSYIRRATNIVHDNLRYIFFLAKGKYDSGYKQITFMTCILEIVQEAGTYNKVLASKVH